MNLFKLVDVVDKKISPLLIEPNLCTKLISPKSTCNHCVEHCPVDCIIFHKDNIEIEDKCIQCGLCTTVCPTSAIFTQRPSLNQIMDEITHKCADNKQVYIQCEKHKVLKENIATITLPCLGAIPREAWMTILLEYENLSIYQSNEGCKSCSIQKGEEVWIQELSIAESITEKHMEITEKVDNLQEKGAPINRGRRAFFSTIFSEVKATNKLAFREMLGNTSVQSYKEKLQQDSNSKVKKQWEEVSNSIVDKFINESAYSFQNKRRLFLEQLKKSEDMREREDIRLPVISQDCTFCGACSILCPTNALEMENENDHTKIILKPDKCVDCKLCEDICYFQSIKLENKKNMALMTKTTLLIEKNT